ncbi:hypothetical protein MMC22_001268 [Lobaria immixta]|nr:hypothetical protein [Lobaria immixta]
MGRQSYMTRLALGRSPYEPLSSSTEGTEGAQGNTTEFNRNASDVLNSTGYVQQYDSRGYPQNLASRRLVRQARRAQNDVLADVGILQSVDENGHEIRSQLKIRRHAIDKAKVTDVRRENEIGLLIAAADLGLFCLANACLLGLRHRMQAFRFYTGVPVLEILKTEWKHLGPSQFLFSGVPASLAFLVLDFGRNYLIRSLYNGFTRGVVWKVRSRKRRHQIRWIMDVIENILKGASFAIIAQFEIFATLQRLILIPSWPLLPHPSALIPLMSLSPVRARRISSGFSLGWLGQLLGSLIVSPLPLWWILCYGKLQVDKRLYAYTRLVLPKPDNPDFSSIKGALEDEFDNDTISGLGFIRNHDGSVKREGTLLEELKKDVLDLYDGLLKLVNISKWGEDREQEEEEHTDIEGIPLVPLQSSNILIDSAVEVPPLLTNANGPRPATPRPSSHDSHILDSQDENHDPDSDISHLPPHGLPRPDSPSHPETLVPPSPTNVTLEDALQPSNHLFNGHLSDGSSRRSSNEQQPTAEQISPLGRGLGETNHRVTALTAHLADAMGSHISTHLADILFFPLEALFIRSVARNFLSPPLQSSTGHLASSFPFLVPTHTSVAASLRAEVFPSETWFGAGLRGGKSGMIDYAGRLALCAGLEMGMGFAVWQLGAGVVWWLGVKVFEWHLL